MQVSCLVSKLIYVRCLSVISLAKYFPSVLRLQARDYGSINDTLNKISLMFYCKLKHSPVEVYSYNASPKGANRKESEQRLDELRVIFYMAVHQLTQWNLQKQRQNLSEYHCWWNL